MKKSKASKIVTCKMDWSSIEPHTVLGAVAQYVRRDFWNGEGHLTLRTKSGDVFESPEVFWSEPKKGEL